MDEPSAGAPVDTERDILVEQLRTLVAELTQANRLKTEFLQTMGHELRTPLTAIKGFVDLLLSEVREPSQIEHLQYVRKNAERLQTLVTDLMELAAVQAGRTASILMPVDVGEVIERSVGQFRVEAEHKGLELEMRCAAGPVFAMGERYRVRTIVQHLLSNAVKFTSAGRVRITCARLADRVRVEIIDTGIGIPEDELAVIFEPFRQLEMGMTRRFRGTGVGLALTKELVELQGGEIGVRSSPGEGSTFWFTLPSA
ncbi:MAG TPA: HAMP domain-containing sensor histidine kinase [Candidatus Dormibacteraeota bacterium]|nr:HAMP domain-containing sensor histidine kinase [Candidatus Dormibacteraeota bacterium]